MTVGIIVNRRARPGKDEELVRVFGEVQAGVRAHEPNCCYYDFYRDQTDENSYFLLERYVQESDLEVHRQGAYMSVWRDKVPDLTQGDSKVQRLNIVSPLHKGPSAAGQKSGDGPAIGMVAKRTVQLGKNKAFEAAFVKCQDGLRREEPGCTYYDLFQAQDDPQVYFIVERYESRADVDRHGAGAHVHAYWAEVNPMMAAETEVLKLELVSPLR